MNKMEKQPIFYCTIIFLICSCARIIEYFIIKTDETIISESFIHKIFGIALLYVILRINQLQWSDIGMKRQGMFAGIGKGLLLGTVCFALAYFIECIVLYVINHDVHLAFYVGGFSLTNGMQKQSSFIFVLLCFNIINAWMEEGMFRGLFESV